MTKISNDELLEELTKRVKLGKIKVKPTYYYRFDEIGFAFESEEVGKTFTSPFDMEKQFRYRQNYLNYCLPLQNQVNLKKMDKETKLLEAQYQNLKIS